MCDASESRMTFRFCSSKIIRVTNPGREGPRSIVHCVLWTMDYGSYLCTKIRISGSIRSDLS